MDDQTYPRQARADKLNDDRIKKHDTRWVGPRVLSRKQGQTFPGHVGNKENDR
jgi:hypothetical protein